MRNQTLQDLIELERAAKAELQRRASVAHALILRLLRQHERDLSVRQRAAIRKYLKVPPASR
ncbi:MAG: hypothetical protein QM581_13870 [Pseudomonas sp.]